MNYFLLNILLVSALPYLVFSAKYPSSFPRCKRDDPNMSECLRGIFKLILPRLNDGIPELFLPPTRVVPKVVLNAPPGLTTVCTNLRFSGHEELQVKTMDLDVKNNRMDLKFFFPKLDAKTDYSLKGSLLGLRLDAQGSGIGNLSNTEETLAFHFERYMKHGKEYLKMKSVSVDLVVGNTPTIQLENIFGNDIESGKQANKLINDNFESLFETARPVVYEVVAEFYIGLTKKLFESFSLDELFP